MERKPLKSRVCLCAAFGAALALGFGLAPGQSLAQDDQSLIDNAQKDAGEAWDATKETTSDAWDATKQGASDAWDATKETSSDAWDATKEGATDAYDGAKDAVEKVSE